MQSVEEVEQQRDGDQSDQHRKPKGGVHFAGPALYLFNHDAVDFICDIVETVSYLFKMVINLRTDDKIHCVRVAVLEEEFLQTNIVEVVDAPLELGQLFRDR